MSYIFADSFILLKNVLFNLRLKNFEISTSETQKCSNVYYDWLEGIEILRSLQSLRFRSPNSYWYPYIINGLINNNLREFTIENAIFKISEINKMNHLLKHHPNLRSLRLINCNLTTIPELPSKLEYLDLCDNRINNQQLEVLLQKLSCLNHKYKVNLERNTINEMCYKSIKKFLSNNENCQMLNV